MLKNQKKIDLKVKTYWTIQHIDSWEQAKKKSILTGDPAWAAFEEPYKWMIDQMVKRLGCPKCYPIWLWTKRPDLRRRWSSDKGAIYILLKVDISESNVLLSDFNYWHCVLNDFPIELYDGELVDKVESWERIFDLQLMKNSPYLNSDGNDPYLQGVTPSIPTAKIKVVKSFKIRFGNKNYQPSKSNH
ncbi:DUF3841 domain-containing protein [Cyclobacterium sediminis]